MKFKINNHMIAIFMLFLFGSIIFGTLLRKLNLIQKDSPKVVFRDRPEFILYDDMPYRYPRRSIDINFRGVDTSSLEVS